MVSVYCKRLNNCSRVACYDAQQLTRKKDFFSVGSMRKMKDISPT